ncbi:MAG: GNVR domain-containing protein, partial [Paraperlucidibaca sp.]
MTNPAPYTAPTITSDSQDDEIDLRELIGSLVDGRWWIAGFTAAALSLGVLYALVATPIYQVNALVQVEDSKAGGLGAVADELGGLFETKTQAATEIELIRSRMVLGKSVEDLHLDIVVTPKHFPIIGKLWAGPALNMVTVRRFDVPRSLQGEPFELVALGQGRFRLIDPEGKSLGEGTVDQAFSVTLQGQRIGLFVRDIVATVGQRFTLVKQNPLQAIAVVSANLSASEQGKQTGIINLTYKNPSVDNASLVLNQITNNYVRQNVERKSAEAEKTLLFLDEQLPEIKRKLEAAEVRFNAYRMRTGTVDISKEGELLLQQSVTAESGLLELQQKRKELLGSLTAEHPSVQVLDKQISALQAQRGQFLGRVDKLPKTQQELLRLTRDLQVSQELYTQLLNNAQQLKVVRAGTVGNVRIIDSAQPTLRPVEPKKPLILVLALLLGGMVGVGFVLIRQALRSGVKDAAQIEARTGVSVLATIPTSKAQDHVFKKLKKAGGNLAVLAHLEPADLAIESLRSLRTSLHFALVDAPNNLLMITGPGPAVGKSFLSVNLAALLASTGERVLLIDADMRRG